jgi:hypothetical protein
LDSDCPDGGCAGGEPVAHETNCHCQCVELAESDPNNPSPPGTLITQTLVQLIVFNNAAENCSYPPSEITQIATPRCGWNTTQTANAVVIDADRTGSSFSGPELVGSPTNCNEMAYGRRTNIRLVGHRNYLDTNGGDQESGTTARTIPRPLVRP